MLKHVIFVLAVIGLSARALAASPQEAADRLNAFIDDIPDLGPGFAAVVVTADEVPLNKVMGVRRASTGAPLTIDTPIYIASQTKAYMGLLAAVLDQRGVLPLDSTLADYWPALTLPDGLAAQDYTLRQLLVHEVPIRADFIVNTEAYVTRIDPKDYPRLIRDYAERRETGFDYDNLGYNIYGAILETHTGKTWQQWLDEEVFAPLKLTRTSARTSDFSLDELAFSHQWQGEQGWHDVRPKYDGMMHSAGGIVTSTADMARFLQLQLTGGGDESPFSREVVTLAHTSFIQTGMEDRKNAYELVCSGYSLGWNLCDFASHEVFIHGGGYTGNRTMMAFSKDLGVGVAAFSNSDNQTGWFTSRTVTMFLQFLTDHPDTERMRALRVERYPQRVARQLTYLSERVAKSEGDPQWQGWQWSPNAQTLGEYAGRYRTGEKYLEWTVGVRSQLIADWGDISMPLEPAAPDLFATRSSPLEAWSPVRFLRDDEGEVIGLQRDGHEYRKVRAASAVSSTLREHD
ncbi:MAG: serine hydrolase domain-containing protein [Pseudomonadota bacterium]